MDGETKVCTRCGVPKLLCEFHKIRKDGEKRRSICRDCRRPGCTLEVTQHGNGCEGLVGNTTKERAEIRANYLAEHALKVSTVSDDPKSRNAALNNRFKVFVVCYSTDRIED